MSDPTHSATKGMFPLVFGIAMAVLYLVADLADLPLFTYHPGTDRIELGFAKPVKDEGPAMYWYGWIATSAIGAAVIAALVTLVTRRTAVRVPFALAWVVPLLLLAPLVWSLRFYWRW